jgi:hypothetical protein
MLNTIFNSISNDIDQYRARRFVTRSHYREKLDQVPQGLCGYWAATASREFEGIPRDAFFFVRAAETLLEFFECVAFSGKPCALPSKAADSVWHAWLRYAPMKLQKFCIEHYGRLLPHLEAPDLPAPMGDALATCLVNARLLAGLPPAGANLPPLFLDDRRLRMPHGYAYQIASGRVAAAGMTAQGRMMDDWSFPAAFAPGALLGCGLVQEWEVQQAARQAHAAHAGGSGCGSVLGSDGGDCSDSGGDAGSGCGSSCGGCGGGGD